MQLKVYQFQSNIQLALTAISMIIQYSNTKPDNSRSKKTERTVYVRDGLQVLHIILGQFKRTI